MVCRDVKPENIVLEGGKAGGRVFLVDFGGVQAAALDQDFGSTIIGKKLLLQAGLHPMLACFSQYLCPCEPCSISKSNSKTECPQLHCSLQQHHKNRLLFSVYCVALLVVLSESQSLADHQTPLLRTAPPCPQ